MGVLVLHCQGCAAAYESFIVGNVTNPYPGNTHFEEHGLFFLICLSLNPKPYTLKLNPNKEGIEQFGSEIHQKRLGRKRTAETSSVWPCALRADGKRVLGAAKLNKNQLKGLAAQNE